MSARGLPGMTMGARKRAARHMQVPTLPRRHALAWLHEWMKRHGGRPNENGVARTGYSFDRARYRIGERLRPCRGCQECNDLAEDHGEEGGQPIWFLHSDTEHPCDYACGGRWMRGPHCDGSGLLPAKRAAR